jgi:uncharacterized protein (TIGR02001 family)
MNRSLLLAAACALGIAAAPSTARAFEIEDLGLTVAVTPTFASDYLFRGISQTRSRPAGQVTLDVEHTSGLYVGAFLSNVTFAGTNARQELDILGGYRFSIGDFKFDLGGVYYAYPGYDATPGLYDLNYFEFAAKGSWTLDPVKLLASAYYSPQFQAESGSGYYLEGGIDIALPLEFTLSGRIGYQWIQNNTRFGTPDFMNFGVFIGREIAYGFTFTAGYYGTNIAQADCVAGQKICDDRFMFTISRAF